jgi:hypothetical protein
MSAAQFLSIFYRKRFPARQVAVYGYLEGEYAMKRREFLGKSAQAVGAAFLSRASTANAAWLLADPLAVKHKASDEIVLGKTGIRTSRWPWAQEP